MNFADIVKKTSNLFRFPRGPRDNFSTHPSNFKHTDLKKGKKVCPKNALSNIVLALFR
jgi:hypothetical protein